MKFKLKNYEDLASAVEKMSVRELLKTVSCPQTTAENVEFDKEYPLVFVHGTTREKAKAFRESRNAGTLICTDTECGAGMMLAGCTDFPSMGALGVCNDEALAYQVGRITARDCVEAGWRWSLSPCVDIRLDHRSPAVSIRSAGSDPETVIKIAGGYMKGLQDGGVVATIKHFPGDGACAYDQHLTTAENPLSREQWQESYGRVYKELIAEGAMCVMPGHISLPAMDEIDPVMGLCPPATLSYNLMTKLLKQELGFEGIICSDALTMGGFCGFMNYYKACATFLKNGGDILLFVRTNEKFFQEMTVLVEEGFLPLRVLQDRAYRVLCFLRQAGELPVPNEKLPDGAALSRQVVEKSVTVERDRFSVLPFRANKDTKILLVDFSNNYAGSACTQRFLDALNDRGYHVELLESPGPSKLRHAAEDGAYDLILCSMTNGFSYGTNVLRLHGRLARNMMDGWTKQGTPVVFVCFYDDTFHLQFAAPADTVVCTRGVADATFGVLLERLFS